MAEKEHTVWFRVKDSDKFRELVEVLGVRKRRAEELIEFGEYATLELTFNRKLEIVSGRLVPLR